jgi:hypothetical protein
LLLVLVLLEFGVVPVVVLVIDLSRDLTSDSLYLLCPPKVLMEVNLPAFAHLVTVFGSTLNNAATSDGVRRFS